MCTVFFVRGLDAKSRCNSKSTWILRGIRVQSARKKLCVHIPLNRPMKVNRGARSRRPKGAHKVEWCRLELQGTKQKIQGMSRDCLVLTTPPVSYILNANFYMYSKMRQITRPQIVTYSHNNVTADRVGREKQKISLQCLTQK